MAEQIEQSVTEEVSGLSPETKQFFEDAAKPSKKKEEPAAKPEQKPEAKPEQKPDARAKPDDKKPDAPKDPPDVERENLKRAMNEERERRKEIAEQLKKEAEGRKALEDKFNRFLSLVQQSEQAPPEFDKDPAGHLKARDEARERELSELRKWREEREQEAVQTRQMHEFQQHVAAQTQEFMMQAPDYADAYKHVRAIRAKELEAVGVKDARQREQLLAQWEMQLAAAAVQLGQNPAAALYGQAQALGFKQQAPQQQTQEEQKPDEKAKLEALARGAEAAKGLDGGDSPGALSLEKIMAMDEEEMAEMVRGKNWNKVAKFFK